MGAVVVGGVEDALLVGALLGGDGGGDRAAEGVEAFRRAGDKGAVGVAVKGIDVLKVDVQPVIALFVDERDDVLHQSRLDSLIGQQDVGQLRGEAARVADIRHREQGRGRLGVGRLDQPPVVDGAQLPLRGSLMREGAERGKPGHGFRQHSLAHKGIDIGVDLDLLAHVRAAAGDHKALTDHEARGIRDLIEPRQLLRRGAEAPREGVETVPRFDNIDLHKKAPFRKQTAISLFRKGAG